MSQKLRKMAVILPFLGSIWAPTLFLAIFISVLAFYRLKIEVTDDDKAAIVEEEVEKNCGNCDCKKIKRISILYGTSTGILEFSCECKYTSKLVFSLFGP